MIQCFSVIKEIDQSRSSVAVAMPVATGVEDNLEEHVLLEEDEVEAQTAMSVTDYNTLFEGIPLSESTTRYLAEIGRIPLYSSEAERRAFTRYNDLRKTEARIADQLAHAQDTKSRDSRRRALNEQREEAGKMRNEIVRRNLRLVVSVAKKYVGLGISLDDLIQEGNEKLIELIDAFDITRGYKFSTLAFSSLKEHLRSVVYYMSRSIKPPRYLEPYADAVRATEARLMIELGTEHVPDGAIAADIQETGRSKTARAIEERHVHESRNMQHALQVRNLDEEIDEDGSTLASNVADDTDELTPILELINDKQVKAKLLERVAYLVKHSRFDETDRRITMDRFGLISGETRSLRAIGYGLGITYETVRQRLESRIIPALLPLFRELFSLDEDLRAEVCG